MAGNVSGRESLTKQKLADKGIHADQSDNALATLSNLNKELAAKQLILKKLNNVNELHLSTFSSFEDAESMWLTFEKRAACFAYQQFSFCRTWYETVGKKDGVILHIVAVKNLRDETLMVLPLCIKKGHFGRIVSFIGDGMADYLSPLVQSDFAQHLPKTDFDILWKQVLTSIKGNVDLVWLDKQPVKIAASKNPLTELTHFYCTSSAHALNFPEAENWSKCARLIRSSKTAGNIERRLRKLAKEGDVELVEITGTKERAKHMTQIQAMKIDNLNDAGTLHRIGTPAFTGFYQALVGDETMQEHLHQFELRCDSKLVASVLGFTHHDTFYYQICAFNRQEFAQHSPGLLLMYKLFDWSFSRGLKRFDMTIGDESYKSDWSNETTQLVTVAVPYSTRGQLEYGLKRVLLWTKGKIRDSRLLSKLAMVVLGN